MAMKLERTGVSLAGIVITLAELAFILVENVKAKSSIKILIVLKRVLVLIFIILIVFYLKRLIIAIQIYFYFSLAKNFFDES
ncbi:hypothetical protein GCM10022397_42670 [Flavivirga jejuensis]